MSQVSLHVERKCPIAGGYLIARECARMRCAVRVVKLPPRHPGSPPGTHHTAGTTPRVVYKLRHLVSSTIDGAETTNGRTLQIMQSQPKPARCRSHEPLPRPSLTTRTSVDAARDIPRSSLGSRSGPWLWRPRAREVCAGSRVVWHLIAVAQHTSLIRTGRPSHARTELVCAIP